MDYTNYTLRRRLAAGRRQDTAPRGEAGRGERWG